MRICSKCGMQYPDTQAYCNACGGTTYPMKNQQTNQVQQMHQQPQGGYQQINPGQQVHQQPQGGYQQINPGQQVYQQPQGGYQQINPGQQMYQQPQMAGYPQARKKKSRAWIGILASVLILGVLAFTGFVKPGFLKDVFKPKEELPTAYESGVRLTESIRSGSTLEMGSLREAGYRLTIPGNELETDTAVSMDVLSKEQAKQYEAAEKFRMIGTPVELEYEGNNGGFFGEQVTLSMYIPEELRNEEGRVEDYVFWIYDEEKKEYRYYEPDYVDLENGVMEVTLPHFCINGGGRLTESEMVEYALETYSTQVVMMQENQKKDIKTLSPYFEKKLDALKLSSKMKDELITSVINCAGSKIGEAYKVNEDDLNDIGMAVDLTTASYNAYNSGDNEALLSKMNDLSATLIVDAINKKIIEKGSLEKFKSEAGWASGNISELGTLAGAIAGGDTDGAIAAAASIIENSDPKIAVVSKAVGYLGAKLDECFINWKDSEVEELYQVYKNGSKDLAVEAGDTDALRDYLVWKGDAASIARWVQIDEVKELEKKLPKGKYYDSAIYDRYVKNLQENARTVAIDSLVEYYEKRLKQEKKVEKIKDEERFAIREMLNETNGALRSDNYGAFFGEKHYSMTERIKKLVNIRKYLSEFIDEDARNKDSYTPKNYNYGYFLNQFISYMANQGMSKEEATKQFCRDLKAAGLLKKNYDVGLEASSMDSIAGTWDMTFVITPEESKYAKGIEDALSKMFGTDMTGVAEVNTEPQTTRATMTIKAKDLQNCEVELEFKDEPGNIRKATGVLTGNTLKLSTGSSEYDDSLGILNGSYQIVQENGRQIFKGKFDVHNYYMDGTCEYSGSKKN